MKTRDTNKVPAAPVKHGPRQFGPPGAKPVQAPAPEAAESEGPKAKRERKPKVKCDPKLLALARELRDRWSEHVGSGEMRIESVGKYDVTRILPNTARPMPALPRAA